MYRCHCWTSQTDVREIYWYYCWTSQTEVHEMYWCHCWTSQTEVHEMYWCHCWTSQTEMRCIGVIVGPVRQKWVRCIGVIVGPVRQKWVRCIGVIVAETCTSGTKLARQPLTTFRNTVLQCTTPLPKRWPKISTLLLSEQLFPAASLLQSGYLPPVSPCHDCFTIVVTLLLQWHCWCDYHLFDHSKNTVIMLCT